jgi:putative ABC transport system permease protein
MWRATIKGLWAHKVRLGLTALAVVLGVAFVSGTYILTDTMNRAFDSLFQTVEKGVAVDVNGIPKFKATGPGGEDAGSAERVPGSLLEQIRAVPAVRAAEGSLGGYAQPVDKHGKAITTGGAPNLGFSWVNDPDLASVTLTQGHAPSGPTEVAIDAGTAQKYGFELGDPIKVLLQGPSLQATVVGIFRFGSANNLLGATIVSFDPQTAQQTLDGGGNWDDILVAANPGVAPSALATAIQKILPNGYQAQTGQQAAAENSATIKKGLSFFNIVLLVFAGIALFVGAFIIFNTFSILIAQRTRELALLRALGASPAQVRRSVIVEAFIVRLVASVVGLVAGFGIAIGLKGLLKAFGLDLPTTTTQLLPRTVIVAIVVGTVTTLVAGIGPALRASRVRPIAALRDAEPTAKGLSRRRILIGLGVLALGVASLLNGLFAGPKNPAAQVGLGAALVFLGMAVLAPLVARPVAGALGRPISHLGMAGRLGRDNSVRNPRRTASTSAALMIGLALVALVSILAASVKASTDEVLQRTLRADYLVSGSGGFLPFSQDVATALRDSGSFAAVEEVRQGVFGLHGNATTVGGIDPSQLEAVANVPITAGSLDALGEGDLMVWDHTAQDNGWTVGSEVTAQFARTGTQKLRVVALYSDNTLVGNYVVSLDTYQANFTQQLDTFLLAKTAPGVSATEAKAVVHRVEKAFPSVNIEDQAEFRVSQGKQINQLLGLITALLSLALLIAVFGIVNTMALSVHERTREIGLLRAVGLSRRQARSMVRWESIIIAVFGAVLGTAVGIFFGWAMVQALKDQGLTVLSLPVGQLLLYVVIAGIFGVFAAIWPARRAAKLDVLKAIATE